MFIIVTNLNVSGFSEMKVKDLEEFTRYSWILVMKMTIYKKKVICGRFDRTLDYFLYSTYVLN